MKIISLDLETTGLDTQKDEPIQIGICITDEKFSGVQKFESYCKPENRSPKDIVYFITNISLKELESAPSIQSLLPKLQDFFSGEYMIVGHNVQFDIAILGRYIKIDPIFVIDTFPLAQTIIHHADTHALEQIPNLLSHKQTFTTLKQKYEIEKANSHDALFDSLLSLCFFEYSVKYIGRLMEAYPEIKGYISKGTTRLKLFFPGTNVITCTLPTLEKTIENNIIIPTELENNLIDKQIYGIKNIHHKTIIEKIIKEGNIIIAHSHKEKLQISKSILNSIGYKQIGYLKEEKIINSSKTEIFLRKSNFSESELYFIIKFFSHHHENIGIIDLSNQTEYDIRDFITTNTAIQNKSILLSTHAHLYEAIEKKTIPLDYKIMFFDFNRWTKSFNYYTFQTIDFEKLLNNLSTIEYHLKLLQKDTSKIEVLITKFTILAGVFSIYAKNLFYGKDVEKINIGAINQDLNGWKIQYISSHIQSYIQEEIMSDTGIHDIEKNKINSIWSKIENIFSHEITINKRMYGESMSFQIEQQYKYTDYSEFIDFLSEQKCSFFSHNETNENSKIFLSEPSNKKIEIVKKEYISSILQYESILILTPSKQIGQYLYSAFRKNKLEHSLIIEFITGSTKKSLSQIRNQSKKIVCCSHLLAIQAIGNGVKFDKIFILDTIHSIPDLILNDWEYYVVQ